MNTRENHKHNKVRSNYESNNPNNGGTSPKSGIPAGSMDHAHSICQQREAKMGLKQRNRSKITYTPWAASMLDCVSQELENKVFPQVFMHSEPIRC